jgi:hypothetical protein
MSTTQTGNWMDTHITELAKFEQQETHSTSLR